MTTFSRGHLLLALAACALAGPALAEDTVKIGVVAAESGSFVSAGHTLPAGVSLAVKEINDAGGVKVGDKCYNLEVVYYDDESTPARAAQLVERLISQDDIKFVLGPYSSPMTKAILPVTEKYKTPVVQSEAASRSLFTQGYKYHFGIIATSEKYLTPVIDMAAEQAKKAGRHPSSVKVAMIFQDDSFSLDVRQGVVDLVKKYNMNTIIDDRMPKDLNDLTAFFTKVKAVKPDVLLISGHEKGAATAARQMGEHRTDVPLIGITHCESAKVVQDFPKVAEGFVCPTQWDETMKASDPLFGTAMDYNNQMKAAHPEYKNVPYQTAQASAAIYVWKDAFERAGTLDQEKVRQALIETDLPTFYGHVNFAEDGSNPGKTMVMRQIQDGKFVVVAPPAVAAGPVVYPRAANY